MKDYISVDESTPLGKSYIKSKPGFFYNNYSTTLLD